MRFADYAKIYLTAGDGGAGSAHFRKEKYVPKGGPDGGDGGRGGHIIIRGKAQLSTILDLRYRKYIKADRGENGGKSRSSGKMGQDIILDVPLGTQAYEAETRRFLGEITEEGQTIRLAQGGMGGLGNFNFKSATNQIPHYAQPGTPGEEIVVELELKLLADVGLVGFPNAGKSTLLSSISAARPKIADYPFTTLEPNLGVVQLPDYRSFVMADIPGIIENAHEGKGLGVQFLRHIERNRALVFVISVLSNVEEEYEILKNELHSYQPELLSLPRLIVINKMDTQPDFAFPEEYNFDAEIIGISAVTGHNTDLLKEKIWDLVNA